MNIIQDILKNATVSYKKIEKDFLKNKDFTDFLMKSKDFALDFARNLISAELESMDNQICNSSKRKKNYNILRRETKTLVTSLGEISFKKTIYYNDEKAYCCLLDEQLKINSHERLTDDARCEILENVVKTSYENSAESACNESTLSRQTVMNELHKLKFPKDEYCGEKKVVDYLYIEADEDHISLQFMNRKGDLKKKKPFKTNTLISKMVYIHEGMDTSNPKRHVLKNVHYFCGNYTDNEKLWDEIYNYCDSHYDLDKVKKIYLNSDGGQWIKSCHEWIYGIDHVLDEFHMEKYLTKMTSSLNENKNTVKSTIRRYIRQNDKEGFTDLVKNIIIEAENEQVIKRINEGKTYILNNWEAAVRRQRKHVDKSICCCTAESHVSHVLSDRMSSRPMGWCKHGADNMAHLLAYVKNGGNMLDLIKYNNNIISIETKKAAGAETLSLPKILVSEHFRNDSDKYADVWNAHLTLPFSFLEYSGIFD